MRYVLIGFFILIIMSEITLQYLARTVNPYGSYPEFFKVAEGKIEQAKSDSTIFFVGDSTIFGGGASNEKIYSLPAQFQNLLKRSGNSLRVVNLGYPGTTGKEHLEILRLLPPSSKVIMRTGINDSWKRHENYKLHIFGHYIEVRLLKLGMIFWYGWMRDETTESATKAYFEELQTLARNKSFNLYFIDYFLGEKTFMNSFFKSHSNFIPLAKILSEAGFSNQQNRISKRFLSYDLVHANDLGYRLQAQATFNWFAARSKLNLIPAQQFDLTVDDEALRELKDTLQSWLNILREEKVDSADRFPFAMKAAWQYYIATGDQTIKSIYDKLANIYINIFHSIYPITYALNRQDRLNSSELRDLTVDNHYAEKLNRWFQLVRIFKYRSNHDYVSEYQSKFPDIMKMDTSYSDYKKLDPPHPIELCPLLIKETGYAKEEFSALEDWEYIFQDEFDINYINEENWKICGRVSSQ